MQVLRNYYFQFLFLNKISGDPCIAIIITIKQSDTIGRYTVQYLYV